MKIPVKLVAQWLISGGLVALPLTVTASAPESPRAMSIDQSTLYCDEIADMSAMERIGKHPYYKQYKQSDWALPVPKSLWYRETQSLSTQSKTVEVRNISVEPLTLTGIDGLGDDFSLTKVNGAGVAGELASNLTIGGKMTGTLELTYSPLVASPINQQRQITLEFADGSEQKIYLWAELADGRVNQPVAACGVLDSANTRYILQNSVTATASCFTVKAKNITLDLNGHTITYGTGRADNSHAIMSGTYIDGVAVGGQVEGLVIKNGTITQEGYNDAAAAPSDPTENPAATAALVAAAAAAGKHNHAIFFNEQPYSHNTEVDNVTINVIGHSTQAVRSLYRSGHHIHHSTFNSKVRTIQNRHQIDGAIVFIARSHPGDPGFSSLHNNIVNGGAQGGLYSAQKHSQLFGNQVKHYNLYTNGFGIYPSADHSDAFDNTVTPDSGRGISSSNHSVRLYNNTIDVQTLPINDEYGGCEMAVYGIQLEVDAVHSLVLDNDVTATAGDCGAIGLRVTDSPASGRNIVMNNDIRAIKESSVSVGIPVSVSLEHNQSESILSTNNRYVTDAVALETGWGGTESFHSVNDSFELGANPIPIANSYNARWLMRLGNHNEPATGIIFENTILGLGLDKDLVLENKIIPGLADVYGPSQYSFATALNVVSENLNDDMSIVYTDAVGSEELSVDGRHIVIPMRHMNRVNSTDSSRHESSLDMVSIDVKSNGVVKRFSSAANAGKTYSCSLQ